MILMFLMIIMITELLLLLVMMMERNEFVLLVNKIWSNILNNELLSNLKTQYIIYVIK